MPIMVSPHCHCYTKSNQIIVINVHTDANPGPQSFRAYIVDW